ncbi:hypothetical protein [Aliarcobacter butzleri]|uniref:Uncharacterized protein n=1 Tax=Aliarcobacter butzleri TaxID=28197 RepID=A0AAW6VJA8_9BACT|nr:hypothetical protein [Aliarcobacter butzleri]MDK2042061.1 hypothetical protein [Aliarcobacter butzleri]MDK2097280.1 hypothetical protein [Aliarcobacter butzleri]
MKILIEKLQKRKKITGKALLELFEIILELEKNIDRDIDTLPTTCKVTIKAEDYYAGEWLKSCAEDDKFSLFVQNGKIKIKNIFSRIKSDEDGEKIEIKLSHSFNYFNVKDNKDKKIIKINFLELIEALKEVINFSNKEAQRIDIDAQEFIDFCTKWKSK